MSRRVGGLHFGAVILVDAALHHRIDDSREYERLVDEGVIKQAPAGTDADYFILSFADELEASVVSNDRFRDRIAKYPTVGKRLIKYMIVQGRSCSRSGRGGGSRLGKTTDHSP